MLQMAGGRELATNTCSMIFVMATWIRGVDGAPFLSKQKAMVNCNCTGHHHSLIITVKPLNNFLTSNLSFNVLL